MSKDKICPNCGIELIQSLGGVEAQTNEVVEVWICERCDYKMEIREKINENNSRV